MHLLYYAIGITLHQVFKVKGKLTELVTLKSKLGNILLKIKTGKLLLIIWTPEMIVLVLYTVHHKICLLQKSLDHESVNCGKFKKNYRCLPFIIHESTRHYL